MEEEAAKRKRTEQAAAEAAADAERLLRQAEEERREALAAADRARSERAMADAAAKRQARLAELTREQARLKVAHAEKAAARAARSERLEALRARAVSAAEAASAAEDAIVQINRTMADGVKRNEDTRAQLNKASSQNKRQLAATLRGVQLLQGADGADPKLLAMSKLHMLGEVLAALFDRLHDRDGTNAEREDELCALLAAAGIEAPGIQKALGMSDEGGTVV